MSVVLCYSCNEYSILATDTRGISFDGKKDDTCKKLLEHKYGWLANVGFSLLSHPLMNLLNEADLEDDILDLLTESYNKLIQLWNEPEEIYMLQKSIVAVSWIGNKITILQYKKAPNTKAVITDIEKNKIYILYPPEYSKFPKKVCLLRNKYNEFNFIGEITECVLQICKIFKEIASNSDSVSNICEIGVLINQNRITYKDDVDRIISTFENL